MLKKVLVLALLIVVIASASCGDGSSGVDGSNTGNLGLCIRHFHWAHCN